MIFQNPSNFNTPMSFWHFQTFWMWIFCFVLWLSMPFEAFKLAQGSSPKYLKLNVFTKWIHQVQFKSINYVKVAQNPMILNQSLMFSLVLKVNALFDLKTVLLDIHSTSFQYFYILLCLFKNSTLYKFSKKKHWHLLTSFQIFHSWNHECVVIFNE